MNALEQLIEDPSGNFSTLEMSFYYLGAAAWLVTYALVIRRIIKQKFVEFPALIIAANVSWEILGGFVLGCPAVMPEGYICTTGSAIAFGGPLLLWSWRAGAIMDVFMLISCLRYGHKQVSDPWVKKNFKAIVLVSFVCFGAIIFTYYNAGYDLPMMFNSGMILNLMMSFFCIVLFMKHKDRVFSPGIAWAKFMATSVFLMIYIVIQNPEAYLAQVVGVICFVLDVYYIAITTKRYYQHKNGQLVPTHEAAATSTLNEVNG